MKSGVHCPLHLAAAGCLILVLAAEPVTAATVHRAGSRVHRLPVRLERGGSIGQPCPVWAKDVVTLYVLHDFWGARLSAARYDSTGIDTLLVKGDEPHPDSAMVVGDYQISCDPLASDSVRFSIHWSRLGWTRRDISHPSGQWQFVRDSTPAVDVEILLRSIRGKWQIAEVPYPVPHVGATPLVAEFDDLHDVLLPQSLAQLRGIVEERREGPDPRALSGVGEFRLSVEYADSLAEVIGTDSLKLASALRSTLASYGVPVAADSVTASPHLPRLHFRMSVSSRTSRVGQMYDYEMSLRFFVSGHVVWRFDLSDKILGPEVQLLGADALDALGVFISDYQEANRRERR